MRKILTLMDYYLPGYKAGGPIQTIRNMVAQLSDHFDFWIVTHDYDLDGSRYDVPLCEWVQVEQARVYYAPSDKLTMRALHRLIHSVKPDVIYLNSFFSTLAIKVMLLRRLGQIADIPVILAPRGEFSPGALRLKARKKIVFRRLANLINLYDGIIWQASTAIEAKEIQSVWGESARVQIASDVPALTIDAAGTPPITKTRGAVRLVFLSRISPKKNLLFLLRLLKQLPGEIHVQIVGLAEDAAYWQMCQHEIAALPDSITVTIQGAVPHEQVEPILAQHHFFVLPTLGENFGHAIFEALHIGCPVILSDQTPWGDVSTIGAGWALPLDQPDMWKAALTACIDMENEAFAIMSVRAKTFAAEWMAQKDLLRNVITLLEIKAST